MGRLSLSLARGAPSFDEDDLQTSDADAIFEFLRKATSPAVNLYPAAVEQWVGRHQHDVSREERWRVSMARQVESVSGGVRELDARMSNLEGMVR